MHLIERRFLAHPATVGETYGEHARFAAWFGARLVLAGMAALVHAALPFAFETTASRQVRELARVLGERAGRGQRSGVVPPTCADGSSTGDVRSFSTHW